MKSIPSDISRASIAAARETRGVRAFAYGTAVPGTPGKQFLFFGKGTTP